MKQFLKAQNLNTKINKIIILKTKHNFVANSQLNQIYELFSQLLQTKYIKNKKTLMGSCMNKDSKSIQRSPNRSNDNNTHKSQKSTKSPNNLSSESFGIRKNVEQKSLTFMHSPLRYCEFLFSKFKQSDGTPQQASLSFMLNKCIIDVQKQQIVLYRINSNLLKIWIIYGGIQKVSQTGLTISINNYKQLQQLKITQSSSNNETGDMIGPIKLCQTPKQNILIIMQPISQSDQTIFMTYRYQIQPNQKQYTLITQWLQWSSLAFRINDIYGSQYLFKCGDQNQVCSICLTNSSECILLPCRHMCVCDGCLQQVQKTKPNCPLCRKQYYSVVKYKSSSDLKSSRHKIKQIQQQKAVLRQKQGYIGNNYQRQSKKTEKNVPQAYE